MRCLLRQWVNRSSGPNEWVILAARRDRDIVEVVQQRTCANGLVGCHVMWAADGPIRIYAGIEDMWDDLFGAQVAQEGVMPGELLTIREAAKRLRVPEVNLWHLIQTKKMPSIQIKAGQWRVSVAVVSALSGDLPDKPRTELLPP